MGGVELTEEEKKEWFPKQTTEDLTKKELGRAFSSFAMPSQAEGFDEVRYAWQPADKAAEYLKAWVSDRKLTQRVEDLTPGNRFREQLDEWNKMLQEWRRRQGDRRDPVRRRQAEKKRRVEEDKKKDEEKDETEKKEGEDDKEKEQTEGEANDGAEGSKDEKEKDE